ncbi:nose resistant to fluoxetine protein 6 [Trichonephila clavipes]|nr:nose resistant to fluoxetine protein 6 [Trichonephila clavipes]
MQLHILGLFVLLPLLRWPKLGAFVGVVLTIGLAAVASIINLIHDFPPSMLGLFPDPDFAMPEKGGNHLVPDPDYMVDALKLPSQAPRVSGESLQTCVAWRCSDGSQHLFCWPVLVNR